MMDRRRESSIRRREAEAGPVEETAEQQLERMQQELQQEVVDRPASGGFAAAEFLSVGVESAVEEERGGEPPRTVDTAAEDLRGSGETVGVRRVTVPDSTAGRVAKPSCRTSQVFCASSSVHCSRCSSDSFWGKLSS